MKKYLIVTGVFSILNFGGMISLGFAATLEGVSIADEYKDLKLRGVGVKHFLFYKIYVAGLYVDSKVSSESILSDLRKRLEVVYLYDVPSKKVANGMIKGIKKNTTKEEFKELKPQIDQLRSFFTSNALKGDSFSTTYTPGEGTTFSFNNKPWGVIEGDVFARALFAVMIGEYPLEQQLKSRLLGLEN